jgi:ribosomal protein L15
VFALANWDASIEVSPQSLIEHKLVTKAPDGVKILGGTKAGATLPQGLRFRDVVFSNSAREALAAAGAHFGDDAAPAAE